MDDNGAPRPTSNGLFTTWCTSLADGLDHAVTDEAFAANRSAPVALCGASVEWGPMELPAGPRCVACVEAVLEVAHAAPGHVAAPLSAFAGQWLHTVAVRLHGAIQLKPTGWFNPAQRQLQRRSAKLFLRSAPTAVAHESDRHQPPTAARSHLAAAGVPAGGAASSRELGPSPAQVASDTVTVTTGGRLTDQFGLCQGADQRPVGTGLGGPNSSAPSSSLGVTETVVPLEAQGQAPQRDDPQPRVGDLSSPAPARATNSRRCVLMTEKPVELAP